jgi:TPR repeat protein
MHWNSWGYGPACAIAMSVVATPAIAAPQSPAPAELFQRLCVANGTRIDAIEASARAIGFVTAANPATLPAGTTAITLARDTPGGRQALVATVGEAEISKKLTVRVKAHACSVTVPASDWDARAYAAQWLGVAPLADVSGTTLYSYGQRPAGNVVADDARDLTAFVDILNAGQLRTLAVIERRPLRGLSWVVFDAPGQPVAVPVAAAPVASVSHDADPFAPCSWKMRGKGATARKMLDCPAGMSGYAGRGFTEETPVQAGQGDTAAMLRMAYFYLAGPKGAHDPAAGLAWARRAADAGAVQGAFDVALFHDLGTGGTPDKAQAGIWYRKAAEGGDPSSMINLAALQLAGDGVAKDAAAAAGWVTRSADAGSIDAMVDMGWMSARGIGMPRDDAAALRWYRRAAEKKDAGAKYRIGVIYADGTGVARDDAEALRWLTDSATGLVNIAAIINSLTFSLMGQRMLATYTARADAGDADAAMRLGLFLCDAKGGHYDPEAAMRLLRIAADAGIPVAMSRIGLMYAKGEGTSRNDAEALRWLRAGGRMYDAEIAGFRRASGFFSAP